MTLRTFETDVIPTNQGNLVITFLGHGSLMLAFRGKNIYIDPYGEAADYSRLPKANLILATHEHFDHLDPHAVNAVRTPETTVIVNPDGARQVPGSLVMRNGESRQVLGILIEAVPAYNLVHKRPDGRPFHPKGVGNGYVLTFGDTRLYVAGDTENIPEMKALKEITIAFLPMNVPYTMTPEMVAEAARAFRPRILYPYHYGNTDVSKLVALLKDEAEIEVRIRKMA